MRSLEISHEPVELFKVLKFEGLAGSGGEAKAMIDAGMVRVNSELETRRRRKLYAGDRIEIAGEIMCLRLSE